MKRKRLGHFRFAPIALVVALAATPSPGRAQTIAQWTFETSQPNGGSDGHWFTNISAEVGNGTASVFHQTQFFAITSFGGNGSTFSLISSNWSVGDFNQFVTSTAGYSNIRVSYDITSGSHGPGRVALEYSTDGVNFTVFGGTNSIIGSGNDFALWTSGPNYTMSFDLSSVSSLNNDSMVVFRLLDPSTISANGGTVAGSVSEAVDNFTVSVVPEPGNLWSVGVCAFLVQRLIRKKR